MKVLVLCVLGLFLLGNQAHAKCTRLTHVTKKMVRDKGVLTETNKYDCLVKAQEKDNFNDNYCKNCGCHSSDHDNT